MACIFRVRPNLAWYCITCGYHTRYGCCLGDDDQINAIFNKARQTHFRMTDPIASVVDL